MNFYKSPQDYLRNKLLNLRLEDLYLLLIVFVRHSVIREYFYVFILGVVLGKDVDLYLVHLYQLAQVLVLLGEALVLEHEVV